MYHDEGRHGKVEADQPAPYAFTLEMHLLQRLTADPQRALRSGVVALAVLFLLAFFTTWHTLPPEGVKLHGNIDTGVDLFGSRTDLFWLLAAGGGMAVLNIAGSVWLKRREPVAALFLLGMTPVVLLGLLGALLFIYLLNKPR